MPSYEVTLKDRTIEQVTDVDAYQQEGQMTTFFRNDEPRNVVDSWSSRIFSVRTSEVLMIRQLADAHSVERLFAPRPISLRPSAARRAAEA
ncbi:MAG: hypothetical protein IT196_20505 [Acidimicrobiales bacterium]|nr:hypothetical protein [Acidimicrobiales bacterium]